MKKILMMAAIAVAAVGSAAAQVGFKVDANVGFSNFHGKDVDGTKMIVGYRAGVAAEIPFAGELSTGQFFFSPGLVFQSKGAKMEMNGIEDLSTRIHYAKIPLLVGARFQFADKMGVSLQFGPYVACGLAANTHMKILGKEYDLNMYKAIEFAGAKLTEEGPLKRFDAGATILATIEYSNFYFQIGTDWGFVKIANDSKFPTRLLPAQLKESKNLDFFTGVGYRF